MKVRWSETSARRLEEIWRYVALDDRGAADALVDHLLERGDSLANLPNRGRRLPEIPDTELRELIDGNYRIVYRVGADVLEVVTVFEAHRLLPVEDLR